MFCPVVLQLLENFRTMFCRSRGLDINVLVSFESSIEPKIDASPHLGKHAYICCTPLLLLALLLVCVFAFACADTSSAVWVFFKHFFRLPFLRFSLSHACCALSLLLLQSESMGSKTRPRSRLVGKTHTTISLDIFSHTHSQRQYNSANTRKYPKSFAL